MVETEARRRRAASSLLVTKLHPPPWREQTVARDRLVERLRATPGIKLTVLAAPAGSGKTTLLGAWGELEQETRPVAWVTLDKGDNDPVVLWSYVLAALSNAIPALDVPSSPELVGASRLYDRVLPELVNELTAVGDAALVLDDFHQLSSGVARDSIAWFIQHAPSTFRLVLGTRSEPGLPLATLRAHAGLLELRAADLAFTPQEAEDLLNGRLGLGLEPESVKGLVERTEGWPAGLYLAALSLQAVDDRDAFVSSFGGESRHVVDFLVDEVLNAHDSATQDLMLRSSVLKRFCGPLCDAVLEQEDSDRLLDGLARTNLFLVPLDDRGTWYRFHHLFAQLLRVELDHRQPGLRATLHERAFAWHRGNGSVDEAIDHALAAGLFAEAGELISTAWPTYVSVNRFATILAQFKRFPHEAPEHPPLLLAKAWVHSILGQREAAEHAIASVDRLGRGDDGPLPDGFSSVDASLATLRGAFPWGDTRSGLESARKAAELEGPKSLWRPLVCLALGAGQYFSGEFEAADPWLDEAAELALAHGRWIFLPAAMAYRSLALGELGRIEEQARLADEVQELTHELGSVELDGEAFVASGAALRSQGRLEEALPLLERGVAFLRFRPLPRPLADALLRQAEVLRTVGQRDAAAEAIAEARTTLESCADPGFLGTRLAALEQVQRTRPGREQSALSDRELVILRMLRGSLSERDIGRELYLSHNTIHSHTRSIYRKLGVSSRSEALSHARELGLIPPR